MNDSSNTDTDWKGGWEEDALDKLRWFRSLSATEKIRVTENMMDLATYFQHEQKPLVVKEGDSIDGN